MRKAIEGSSALLLGYSREGRSTHRFLLQHYPQLRIGIADSKLVEPIPEAPPSTALHCGPGYLDAVRDYDCIIHTPVVSMRAGPAASAVTELQRVTSATNLFFEHAKGRIIGVTGTKGKSTTSSLIAAVLARRFPDVRLAGNIGKPMLDELGSASEGTIFVLELSSFQLEDLEGTPDIAVLLNIVPEHLDHHGSFENYREAKGTITRNQTARGILVYNPEFEELAVIARESKAQKLPFGSQSGEARAWIDRRMLFGRFEGRAERIAALEELPLKGPGNAQNMMAAVTVGIALGIPAPIIREALLGFKPLEHRLEIFGNFAGITFVNDSLSTIPEALVQALEAFPGAIDTIIAGGFDRGLDYGITGAALATSGVRNLILFPTTGEKIWNALLAWGTPRIRRFNASTMEEAAALALEHTAKGKMCIMSPASSSFNLFKDYKERGDRFKEAVRSRAVSGAR